MYSAYNYYTKVKGRKFQIPFFDDDFLSSQFAPSSVKNPKENYELDKLVIYLSSKINHTLKM